MGGTPVSCEDGQDAPAELATTDSPFGSAAAPASRRKAATVSLDRETWTIHGLTTEHLANLLGTTRQTLSTILNALAKDGLLELRGRGLIHVPDPDALD